MTSLTASVVLITGNIGERQRLGNCCDNRRRVWYTAHDGAWWHPCWSGPRQCVRNSDPWLQIRQGCSSRQWWASRLWYALWARSYVASESQEVDCSHSLLRSRKLFTSPINKLNASASPFLQVYTWEIRRAVWSSKKRWSPCTRTGISSGSLAVHLKVTAAKA